MSLPQTNATLTEVAGPGLAEDYDTVATVGTAKWTGRAAAYYSERSDRVEQSDTSSIVVTRALIVSAGLKVEWSQGDTLTFTYRNSPVTGQVRAVERHQLPGVPNGTVRLTLEDQ